MPQCIYARVKLCYNIYTFMTGQQEREIIQALLKERGIGDGERLKFFSPSLGDLCPLENYKGLEEVAARLTQAIREKQKIIIYGDYDCDGLCATAILYEYLTSAGAECGYYIPDRHTEGYGLNFNALTDIAEREFPDLIISVDCGITSVEEVRFAQEDLGIDMIITDHHEPAAELPDCPVFDPKLSDGDVCRDLCGAGVAFRLVQALDKRAAEKFLDVAAIATVADVVPLTGDNRVITSLGLALLNKRRRRGLNILIDSCVKGAVTARDIAFKLGPRINATGRVETAYETVALFYEKDAFLLETLVKNINECNERRKQFTADLTRACVEKLQNTDLSGKRIIVLYDPYWDDGVLGITASRLTELYNRPVILITDSNGEAKGSGRSVEGVDILDCVRACSSYLVRFGGHKRACGITIKKSLIKEFDFVINRCCENKYPAFTPRYKQTQGIEIELPCSAEFAEALSRFEPCGEGNPRPVFTARAERGAFTRMGGGAHVKESLSSGCEMVQFYAGDRVQWYNSAAKKKFAFNVEYSVFNNVGRASLMIADAYPVQAPPGQLLLSSYLKMSAGGGENSVFSPESIDEEGIKALKGKGVCIVANSAEGARLAERAGEGFLTAYGRPYTPCPYDTVIYGLDTDADLAGFSHVVFAEMPLLEGGIDRLTLNKNCRVYVAGGCPEGLAAPSYEELGEAYKAVRSCLKIKQGANEASLYNAAGKALGWEKFIACLFTFVDLGIIIYDGGGFNLPETLRRRELAESRLYRRLKEEYDG